MLNLQIYGSDNLTTWCTNPETFSFNKAPSSWQSLHSKNELRVILLQGLGGHNAISLLLYYVVSCSPAHKVDTVRSGNAVLQEGISWLILFLL